jgi:hypothetical protein
LQALPFFLLLWLTAALFGGLVVHGRFDPPCSPLRAVGYQPVLHFPRHRREALQIKLERKEKKEISETK